MKKITNLLFAAAISIIMVTGCDNDEEHYYDYTPPAKPTNVIAINGDQRIDLTWKHNRESDLSGYNVYFSYDDYEFELIGSTEDNYYIDYDAKNGEVYYYAVTAYDFDGNESDLSEYTVVGIARPEGFNQAVFDYLKFPGSSAYNFENYAVVAYDSDYADFFFENYDGTFYINVWDDTDIQDMGSTGDIYDVQYAPTEGWIPLVPGENVKYVEVKAGHTYVIWTWNNHFAKVRVKQITSERMVFDWAYQLIEGETLLKAKPDIKERTKYPEIIKNR